MLALLLLLQAPGNAAPAAADAADAPAVESPRVEPWEGSYADGLRAIRRLAEAGETDAAVGIAERLIAPGSIARRIEDLTRAEGWRPRVGRALESAADRLDLLGPPPAVRAEAQFARGVALDLAARSALEDAERARRREGARLAFESARLLAGPGALRLDATYQQGWIALAAAEEQRAQIPEISGQPPPPQPTAPPVPDPAGAPRPPDALAAARAAYLGARERFIERLRLEWRDPDTQANVELIQRRLRELDEIEAQRKEQEQQQEQDQDPDRDPQQDPDPKKSKDPQESEDPKPQDPGEDNEQEPDPKESEPEPDPKEEKTEPQPADPQDVQAMSKEEMMQLLERLERIEEVRKELQEKLKRMRRASVERDW